MRLFLCGRFPAGPAVFLVFVLATMARAETAYLRAVADTTLIEVAPTNNHGGQLFFNAGSTQMPRGPGLYFRNRGLFRFDFTGVIPPGSVITRAELRLEVVGHPEPGNAVNSEFSVHRLLRDWGEGDKVGLVTKPGLGEIATTNEATWTHRFSFTTNTWGTPGGQANVDYDIFASTVQFVEFQDTYIFPSREDTVLDVQRWVDHPEQNFGYLIRTRSENTLWTARRFASSEDPFNAPLLIVDYIPFKITTVQLTPDGLQLSFEGKAGTGYRVEHGEMLPAESWGVLTNVPPLGLDDTVLITDPDPAPDRRFYRVVSP